MRSPRNTFLEDLSEFVNKCHDNNDQVVLMMDCNEDIGSRRMSEWLDRNKLEDAVRILHGNDNVPATYHQGSRQIDGIFISSTINPI